MNFGWGFGYFLIILLGYDLCIIVYFLIIDIKIKYIYNFEYFF